MILESVAIGVVSAAVTTATIVYLARRANAKQEAFGVKPVGQVIVKIECSKCGHRGALLTVPDGEELGRKAKAREVT